MKQQIANRLGVAHVRDTVMQFIDGSMTREQAMASLGVGKTRLYKQREVRRGGWRTQTILQDHGRWPLRL